MEASKPGAMIRNSRKSKRGQERNGDGGGGNGDAEECDVEAWDTLSRSFKRAQAVLDQNRELILRVNENHQSRIPDNLAKNVGLINEINGNISKVLGIYSDLSINFSDIVNQRRTTNKIGDTINTNTATSRGRSSNGS